MTVAILDYQLRAVGIPIEGVADNGDGTYRVDFLPSATPQQQTDAAAIVAAFDPIAEQAILDAIEANRQLAMQFDGLPEWAAYTASEAVAAIHAAILGGDTLAQAQGKVDALPNSFAGMKTGLKSAAAEVVTIRNILEKMSKIIVYLRDRTA